MQIENKYTSGNARIRRLYLCVHRYFQNWHDINKSDDVMYVKFLRSDLLLSFKDGYQELRERAIVPDRGFV